MVQEALAPLFKRLVVASAACLALGCVTAAPTVAFEPRVHETFFGVSAPELWAETAQNRDASRDSQLDGMKAMGADWVRVELGWPEVEPAAPTGTTHSYSWAVADRLVRAFAVRHMELLAMPAATPAWAASADGVASSCGRRSEVAAERAADYAAFVGAAARRYGPDGTFWTSNPSLPKVPIRRWELWNEPNWNGFWCPEPDPEAFASMLRRAADAVHAADPGAQVILGGLAALQDSKHQGEILRGMAADDFLARAVAHEPALADAIDAVGFHPYDLDVEVNISMIGWLHRKMESVGLGEAEIVLTEFGWRGGVGLGALTELLRAENFSGLAGRLPRTDCGITGIAAHTWQTSELNILNPDHWWGISSPLTGLLHPSGLAYKTQVALYEGRGPTPAPRRLIEVCGALTPPDIDGDGIPDEEDDFPTDPDRDSGSGEEPPLPPEVDPPEPRPRAPRTNDSFFGATVVQLPTDFMTLGENFSAMASARISSARMRIDWDQIEPVAPSDPAYRQTARWDWLDRIVLKMGSKGIRLTPSFGVAPSWVRADGATFEAHYAEFVLRVAKRYGRGGSFWLENRNLDHENLAIRDFEVWQYGNAADHAPDGVASPARYADIYLAVQAAVSSWDPDAKTVASLAELGAGGTAGSFLRAMVAARPSIGGKIDAVHVWAEHSRSVAGIDGVLRETRDGLDDSGNAQARILLSFGQATQGPGAQTEPARAAFFAEVASRAARGDCGVDGIFAHAWTTAETNPDNLYEWFGIADPNDFTLTDAAIAFRDVAAAFGGYGSAAAPAAGVHPCVAMPPDSDADGTADPADPAPRDPSSSEPTQAPPPAPVMRGGPAATSASRTASFDLSAAGAVSYQCRLDDSRWEACGESPSFNGLSHGPHQLRVRAVDDLGLVGPQATTTWVVDIEGPRIQNVDGPIPLSLDSRVEFTFSSDDPEALTMCQFDGHPWQSCSSPKVYPLVGDGEHEFRAKAVDAVGNVGPVHLTRLEVRTTPGEPAITSGPAPGGVAGVRPEFAFTAPFAAAYECRFDSEPWDVCSGSSSHVAATPLAEGDHVFEVQPVGGTGKFGSPVSRSFKVDATAPIIEVDLVKAKKKKARFVIKAQDMAGISSLECRMDSGEFKACAESHLVKKVKRGRHVFAVRATDSVGNAGLATVRWKQRKR